MKRVFSIVVTSCNPEVASVIHAGVTCVMPNLGGLLIQTKDRDNIQIDSDEMTHGFVTEFRYLSEDVVTSGEAVFGKVVYKVVDHTR